MTPTTPNPITTDDEEVLFFIGITSVTTIPAKKEKKLPLNVSMPK